jgi:hypothetical protein
VDEPVATTQSQVLRLVTQLEAGRAEAAAEGCLGAILVVTDQR